MPIINWRKSIAQKIGCRKPTCNFKFLLEDLQNRENLRNG